MAMPAGGLGAVQLVMECAKPQTGREAGEGIGAVGQDHVGKDSLRQTLVGHSRLLILWQFCRASFASAVSQCATSAVFC